jgi:hypothetical protein
MLVDRPRIDRDDRLRQGPAAGEQLDRIEANGNEQIRALQQRPFENTVGEDAAEPGIVIRNDAFRLVRRQRGNVQRCRDRSDRRLNRWRPRAKPDEEERTAGAFHDRLAGR